MMSQTSVGEYIHILTYYVSRWILPTDILVLEYSFEVLYICVYKTTDICSYQFRDFSAYMLLFFCVCFSITNIVYYCCGNLVKKGHDHPNYHYHIQHRYCCLSLQTQVQCGAACIWWCFQQPLKTWCYVFK